MHISMHTPVGWVTVVEQDGAIVALDWGREAEDDTSDLLEEARRQLDAYFAGTRQAFDLPLAPPVSGFVRQVLNAMIRIPFGETRTYGDLSKELGVPAQAIGQACGANPISIIIPCHRILAADSLGGYSGRGGVETKVKLLRHEGAAGLLL